MEDHVVLVGLGAVGLRVLEGLRALGRDVVVIEYDERNRYVQHARSLGVPIVHGDATLGQTLRSVNIADAGAVAILTSDDLVNLETGLAVRDLLGARWKEVPVVLRVFDRALGHRLEKTFKFHHVWSTSALAAPWFVGAVLGLEVLATFYVRNQPFLVARLTVRPDGGLVGLAMRELSARIRVVAIVRGGTPTARWSTLHAGTRASPRVTRPTWWAPTRSCCACSRASARPRSRRLRLVPLQLQQLLGPIRTPRRPCPARPDPRHGREARRRAGARPGSRPRGRRGSCLRPDGRRARDRRGSDRPRGSAGGCRAG